ncbi:VOC family protein [Paeniglutamicibacter antarcticus]|uniref:VOC family protein n=2 Tax=Paeniglutamicibacter antarcticus TaxID=494023 RepID=A0ABP9TP05_9MICC
MWTCQFWFMTVNKRVVPIITVKSIEAERRNHAEVLGLVELMNHGWIVTFADVSGAHQVFLMTRDPTAPVNPQASIQGDNVDAAYATACARGLEIMDELQDEPWGVRRFFFREASGNIINVLSHLG